MVYFDVLGRRNDNGFEERNTEWNIQNCPPGKTWIRPYYRKGSYIAGHCAKIQSKNHVSTVNMRRTKFGFERLSPVFIYETQNIEVQDGTAEF
jgi:hypothetical protein